MVSYIYIGVVLFGIALLAYSIIGDEPSEASYATLFFTIGVSASMFSEELKSLINENLTGDILVLSLVILGYGLGAYYGILYRRRRKHSHGNRAEQ